MVGLMTLSYKAIQKITLKVPTINDYSSSDFSKLFKLLAQVEHCKDTEIIFDFSDCNFLRQNAVAFLGGLAKLIKHRGGRAEFAWHTMQHKIHRNLEQNSFVSAFNVCVNGWEGNCIPYRQDICNDIDERVVDVMNYLDDQWLGRGWIDIETSTKNEVIQTVLELYRNAFDYSSSEIGVFTCGQHYPAIGVLKLSIVDFGVGIPYNVRMYLHQEEMLAKNALQWAFQRGNTTRRGMSGGYGLDMVCLRNFVNDKNGKIEIYSHDGQVIIAPSGEIYQNASTFFKGTMINISLQCV
jgi:hypothetical protein